MSLFTLYLDDSTWEEKGKEWIVWGGFIINENDENALLEGLKKIKAKFKLELNDPIKWNPSSKKSDLYKGIRGLKDINAFRKCVLEFIATQKITIITACMKGSRSKIFKEHTKQMINDIAVRYQMFIQEKLKCGEIQSPVRGAMVVSFPSSDKEAKSFSDYYFELKRESATLHSNNFQRATPHVPVKLEYLEAGLYFAYESHSPALQIADIISGCTISALVKDKWQDGFLIIKNRFRQYKCNIKGAGILSYPSYESEIDTLCALRADTDELSSLAVVAVK